jgi:glycosyltransferase involved in cell wall biosynthesis
MSCLTQCQAPGRSIERRDPRPIHVCFMIDRLSRAGTEMQLLSMIRRFDRDRVRPHLCLLDGEDEGSRVLEPEDCPLIRLGVRRLLSPRSASRAVGLGRFLHRFKIDIFQPHFPDSTYLGVPVARASRVKRIVLTRRDAGYWVTPADRMLGRLIGRLADATIANSEEARASVVRDYRLEPGSVIVLENGVDLSRFESIPDPDARPASGRRRLVGMVANLRPVKAPEVLLLAARKLLSSHDDLEFHVAGEGVLHSSLQQLANELGIADRVRFLGRVTDIPGFLAGLSVAVLCSRSEGLSNALLEYMAAGRPIVATAVGGNPRLVQHDVEGLLVPSEDADATARAIELILTRPGLASTLGRAAREKARRLFGIEAKARELEEFYARVFWSSHGPASCANA